MAETGNSRGAESSDAQGSVEQGDGGGKEEMFLSLVESLAKPNGTDEERFASLLLLTRVMDATDSEQISYLHQHAGTKFINRLLKTQRVPEGCAPTMFAELAITLLSIYCCVPSLATMPDVLDQVAPLAHWLEASLDAPFSDKQSRALVPEILECLVGMAGGHGNAGVQAICGDRHAGPLALRALAQYPDDDSAWALASVVAAHTQPISEQHAAPVAEAVARLSALFAQRHDDVKFRLCNLIGRLVAPHHDESPAFTSLLANESGWAAHVRSGLQSIVTSKLGADMRGAGLALAAAAMERLGCDWMLIAAPKDTKGKAPMTAGAAMGRTDLLSLVVRLACVEVRMGVEDRSLAEAAGLAGILSASYTILERALTSLANQGAAEEGSEWALQVAESTRGPINDAMTAIISFLLEHGSADAAAGMAEAEFEIVWGSVRVLSAWLAEETEALRTEVNGILPALLAWCAVDRRSAGDAITRMLLPGLLHLTSDPDARAVFLAANGPELLAARLYAWAPDATNVATCTTALNAFLNVAVLDPAAVADDVTFAALLKHLVRTDSEDPVYRATAITLALFILRHQLTHGSGRTLPGDEVEKLFRSALDFVWQAHGLEAQAEWADIGELWFLASQILGSCAAVPEFQAALRTTPVAQLMLAWLRAAKPADVSVEKRVALYTLLCEIAKSGDESARYLKDLGAEEVATIHNMPELAATVSKV